MSNSRAPLTTGAPAPHDLPDVIDGRYRIDRLLGRGGMGVVVAAWDLVRNRDVALKRMSSLADARRHARNLELFEREFHMLSQLAHPRIVEVFDFGRDGDAAYYTMELLAGRDLVRLSPMAWRDACTMARDVCSALSLLHSRRFVHRDISPRNVRFGPDATAKLIDFGLVAPMGPARLLVGTPPCCPPEAVNLQPLDGRSDLFALGATLYFALVGRHAYPAPYFTDLRDAWQQGFAAPSDLVAGIPKALDALVLELLLPDPDARPSSAAEVLERLGAIDGALAVEALQTAFAYLATPPLVGREAQLARVQEHIERDLGRRSRSVIVQGRAGTGRTRLLDACLLRATLGGHTVVRCDADDGRAGEYGVVRAIARQLFERTPELARETAAGQLGLLADILPESAGATSDCNPQPVARAQLQATLQDWLRTLARKKPLVLAVDDFHCIDEPSASLLALLEGSCDHHALCLLLSVEQDAQWTAEPARKLLQGVTHVVLDDLSPQECERLLGALFGDAPNLGLLAQRVQELSRGNPRDLMRLAQHFVDRGLVRYTAGAWTLPTQIDAAELPQSLAQTLSARIERLQGGARRLAWALALCPDQRFSFDDCAQLCAELDRRKLFEHAEALTNSEIVRRIDDTLALSDPSWVPLLRATLSHTDELVLQARLGELFERREAQPVRAAAHWFRADRADHALDLLVEHARSSQELTARGPEIFARYIKSLPPGWFETFDEAIFKCRELDRPREHEFVLLSRLSGILPMLNVFSASHTHALLSGLKRESGLEDWEALESEPDPKQRLMKALQQAAERHQRAPERLRVNDPATAIRHLARAVVGGGGSVMLSLDLEHLRSWPRLDPLAPLSPAIQVAVQLVTGIDARCAGRNARARRIYAELLQRVQQPDQAGLDPAHAGYIALGVMNGLGVLESQLGLDSCLAWAERLSGNPSYEVNAVLIRMLHQTWNGDVAGAQASKRSAERLRIQNVGHPMYEGQHLIGEVQAHALSGDLTRVRRARDEIEPFARRHRQWLPVLGYAKAEYHRLVGNPSKALRQIERVVALAPAGTHQIWPAAASLHVALLLELDHAQLAATQADAYACLAASELEEVPQRLSLAHALARAKLGHADAADEVDAVIRRMDEDGFGTLHRGMAYEVRARIALLVGDSAMFDRCLARCAELLCAHKNTALTAKYHRLMHDGMRQFAEPTPPPTPTLDSPSLSVTHIELALASCVEEAQRAHLALTLLLGQSGSTAGVLFMAAAEGTFCAATVGDAAACERWLGRAAEYMRIQTDQMQLSATRTGDESLRPVRWLDERGQAHLPVLLGHSDRGMLFVTGVAVLAVPADGELTRPSRVASAISRFYADHGVSAFSTLLE